MYSQLIELIIIRVTLGVGAVAAIWAIWREISQSIKDKKQTPNGVPPWM